MKLITNYDNLVSTSKRCCPPGWVQYQSHCYRGITDPPLPFFDVSKQCRKYGAHFVSIHSKEEYAFVKQAFDLNKYWIGVVTYEDARHENEVKLNWKKGKKGINQIDQIERNFNIWTYFGIDDFVEFHEIFSKGNGRLKSINV